jgi:SAM-dependent methyltransferase
MTTRQEVTGWRTAIQRSKLSTPAAWLLKNGKLQSGRGLDYGCGKGFDASHLRFEGYDPYYRPVMPEGLFDVITCTYVLNVLPPEDRIAVLMDIERRLQPDGVAYVTVRRDVPAGSKTQWDVEPDLDLVYERRGAFAIYELRPWKRS